MFFSNAKRKLQAAKLITLFAARGRLGSTVGARTPSLVGAAGPRREKGLSF